MPTLPARSSTTTQRGPPVTAWADKTLARRHWADSGAMDDTKLDELLAAAQRACEQYAPTLAPTDAVPAGYGLAVVYHARDLATAATRDGDVIGVGDYAIRVRDLSSTVKALLRPRRRGGVG